MIESRRRNRSVLACLLAVPFLATVSTASPAPRRPTVAAKGGAQAPKPPEPTPAPDVTLTIHAPTTRGPWTMRVTNVGDVPVRIAADARLLSLEVTPRGARVPVRCELPEDMRPSSDREGALVVPAKRSYAETFEPRLYCFGEKLDALAPGSMVVARLGWPAGSKTAPPFEVASIEGLAPERAPLKSIEAPPIALPDEPSPALVSELVHPQDVDPDAPRLSLEGAAAVDSVSPNEIEIPVTLRNEGQRTVVVRFRPEVLSFDVISPAGIEHCAWPTMPATAMPEMFTTLGPSAAETLNLSLADYCTRGSLDKKGLLVVRPQLDTRRASGLVLGLRTFDGTLTAAKPTVVRLHRGGAPVGPLRRPRLEDQ